MQVSKKILFLLLLVLVCKKPTLEEFHKELCYEKMNEDFINKYMNLPDDIDPKHGYFLSETGPYHVSKADAERIHLLREGDQIFRIDDCAISNLLLFDHRVESETEVRERGYFSKLELLFYIPGILFPQVPLNYKIWIYRNHDVSLIYVKNKGNTIKDPCDETCYED